MTQEALKLALEALITASGHLNNEAFVKVMMARDAVVEALAQPEQEPVAWGVSPRYEDSDGYFDFTDLKDTADTLQKRGWTITPLYTTPPQRKPLTDGLPCCGYTDATAIKWNEFNHAVQCHNCGHTYTQTSNKPLTLYTAPPQRTFVGMTDKEIDSYFEDHGWSPSKDYYPVIRAIEAKLKENNGA